MSKISKGDTVRCNDAISTNGRLATGTDYVVNTVGLSSLTLEGIRGSFNQRRFSVVSKASTKKTPFGQVRSVTVNKSDIHEVLTQYVRLGLGIDATVEKLVDKFPEAIELVLKHEVAA